MRPSRFFLPLFVALTFCVTAFAQEKDLLSLVADLGAGLEWDPLRDRGVISLGDDRISLGIGLPLAIINYRLTVAIPARSVTTGLCGWLRMR